MSLNSLKRRISSIQNTSKITNAMKLIASSKLAKQTKKFLSIKDYYSEYYSSIARFLSLTKKEDFKNIICNNDNTLWIVINSNLGLCGGYNVNLYKLLDHIISKEDSIMNFGKKGSDHFNKIFPETKKLNTDIININDEIEFEMCQILSGEIYDKFNEGQFSKIKIAYTKFQNAITFIPTILDVFPFDEKIFDLEKKSANEDDYDFEPNKATIIQSIIPEYISMVLYASLTESILSENASRRNAMDTATTNAGDLIDKYKLKYNRVRQSNITNEIIEIVAGNEE